MDTMLLRVCLCLVYFVAASEASWWTTHSPNSKDSVRLVDGTSASEGRVEVLHNGLWGTVCDDLWDMNDARVVCRQLGFTDAEEALQGAYFGEGSVPILLDNLQCSGSETSLDQCSHNGYGSHNCGHYEDASVRCKDETEAPTSANCAFENDLCGYYQLTDDQFDWTRYRGSTSSSNTGPSGDHTTGTGYYMYIEATGVTSSSRARLASPLQDATDDQALCLVFFYHMYGDSIYMLNVFLASNGNRELIFTRSNNLGDKWLRATAHFQSSTKWQIIFEGIRGASYTGDIAIDDISIMTGACLTPDWPTRQPDETEAPTDWLTIQEDWPTTHTDWPTRQAGANCSFDNDLCGYYQLTDDQFDWTRRRWPTDSSNTGPSRDHTTGTGYYMYIETSNGLTYWKARLASPLQDATDNQGLCLVFFYHMYGDSIYSLNVFLASDGNRKLIFTKSQNSGDKWLRATAHFQSSTEWQIIFEGIRGASYTGDIAIDDISIITGACPTPDETEASTSWPTTQAGWLTTQADWPTRQAEYRDGPFCSESLQQGMCCKRFGLNGANDRSVTLSSSSEWSYLHGPHRAGLFQIDYLGGSAGWRARYSNDDQWIQVDFGYPRKVTGVLLQGAGCCDWWVTEYRVLYSDDLYVFYSTQVMQGSFDRNTVMRNFFEQPIVARYVRINPVSWQGAVTLRFDLLGCEA